MSSKRILPPLRRPTTLLYRGPGTSPRWPTPVGTPPVWGVSGCPRCTSCVSEDGRVDAGDQSRLGENPCGQRQASTEIRCRVDRSQHPK